MLFFLTSIFDFMEYLLMKLENQKEYKNQFKTLKKTNK